MAELRHYRYFVEVATRGSFTAAAHSLHITQSAISEQIASLERELGCKLFERGRHGARLTACGERLLERAQGLLRAAADLERAARSHGRPDGPTIRIGATMGPLFADLPEALHALKEEVPGVEVVLRDTPTAETLLRVGLGELDLGVVSLPDRSFRGALSAGIESVILAEEDWVILAPTGHELADRSAVPLGALRDEPLILFPRTYALRLVIDEFFARAGVTVEPAIETGWLETAIKGVQLGLGISVVPRAVADAGPSDLVAIEIDEPEVPRRVLAAFYRSDSPNLDLVERFLDLLGEHPAMGAVGAANPVR